uniref:A-type ATP synthase subunit I n=1 Tax=Ignisphaera aggregans TaxID=334771 RepID=A0A7C4NNK0_9CREN
MANIGRLILSEPDFAVKTYIVVPNDYLEVISIKILELGALEVITPKDKSEEYKKEIEEIINYYNLLENAKKLYEELTFQLDEEIVIEIKYTPKPSEFKDLIKRLTEKFSGIANEIKRLNDLIVHLKNEIDELELYKSLIKDIVGKYPEADASFLSYNGVEVVIETFQGPPESISQLQARALYTISIISKSDKSLASLAFPARDFNKIAESLPKGVERSKIVEKYNLRSLKEFIKEMDNDVDNYKNRLTELITKKKTLIRDNLEDIALLKVILDLEYERVKALYESLKSRFVTLIMGWVPETKRGYVENLVKNYPVQVIFEESANPPAEFKNLELFKPFELITEMNGAPSKTDWDPTPLLTYAFGIFFGLMMSDIGYSIGLIIASKYILSLLVEDPKSEGVRKLQRILYVVGFSGIAVGVLSKSFFGDLLGKFIPIPQPLINPMNAQQLIVLSLVFGWIWIFLSHVLAFVKNVRKLRDAYGAISELAIIAIMLLGTFMILHIMYTNKLIERIDLIENNYSTIKISLIASIALLVFSKVRTSGALGAILWIFDVVGILGDVFSFIRIAGIALGTAILAYIFNLIIGGAMATNIALGILAAIGLHFFAFMLSPISPFVHSLRLCMLEISSKFYEGMNQRVNALKVHIPSKITISSRRKA